MTDLEKALSILDQPRLDEREMLKLSESDLAGLRADVETSNSVCKRWLLEARSNRALYGVWSDAALYRRVEDAQFRHAELLRFIAKMFAVRKERRRAEYAEEEKLRKENLRAERDEAIDLSRKLAGELEKLSAEVARLQAGQSQVSGGALHLAFFEVSRVVLAEATFNRILERARERVAHTKKNA